MSHVASRAIGNIFVLEQESMSLCESGEWKKPTTMSDVIVIKV
jgi:hypothetical protein